MRRRRGHARNRARSSGGLLGADYTVENGRYRFARVFSGENWNPQLRAPLTQPGVNVQPGEYLLAVNGRDLRAADEPVPGSSRTPRRQVDAPRRAGSCGAGARDVTVVPVGERVALRNYAWIEDNRRKVDQLTGGKLAYVYLPDTAGGGYTHFNRYFFAQVGKEGAVLDERFNGGGQLADYIIDYLRRPLMARSHPREGEDQRSPSAAIFGPRR